MNLYFRLLWLILRFPFMPKQTDPLGISTLTMRVLPNDLDLNFHMNNGRYLTLMDLGRLHLMGVSGLLKIMLKKHWAPMLGSVKVHFIRPLNLFDQYQLTTQVVYWDEKWIYIEQKMIKNGVLCLTALVKTLLMDKNGKIPSAKVLTVFSPPPAQPPIPEAVRHWIEAENHTKPRN